MPRADQNDPDKIGRIFGVELCHDARAMRLDGSLADAEMTSGFLIGGSSDYLAQHLLFPLRQWRIDQKLSQLGHGDILKLHLGRRRQFCRTGLDEQ